MKQNLNKQKYILTIDGGSQSTKCVVYDLHGNIIAQSSAPLSPCILGENNLVEHNGDDVFDSLKEATNALMSKGDFDVSKVIGVGIGSIRCCRVLLDKDFELAQNIINWQDIRTSQPSEYTDDVKYITSLTGYLCQKLTGQKKDNIGNYLGQYPVDYKNWCWSVDDTEYKKYNITREMLFDYVLPGSVVGTITETASLATGLPVGLPLVTTSADKAVEMLGSGLVDETAVAISLGTYISMATMAKDDLDIPSPQSYWTIMSSIPHKLICEGYGIRRGMWTVSWFRDLLGQTPIDQAKALGISVEDYLNQKAQDVPAGSDGLMTVLDWLANPWEAHKRGIMIGFDAHMDFAYMYRSILEGIVYTLYSNYYGLCVELAIKPKVLIVSGGGSKSDLMMQIFADVFDMPVVRNVVSAGASLGAAINTSVGLYIYPDYTTAVKNMIKVEKTFYPDPKSVAIYKKLVINYKTLTRLTDEVLQKNHQALMEIKGMK